MDADPDLRLEASTVLAPLPPVLPSLDAPTVVDKDLPFLYVPLLMTSGDRRANSHTSTPESSSLVDEAGGPDALLRFTTTFYSLAFEDSTLDKFIRSHDDPHPMRFALWIAEKLGKNNRWTMDRMTRPRIPVDTPHGELYVRDRGTAHAAAWSSPKRPRSEMNRKFKLHECRIWMRLHFYSLKKAGIHLKSPSFADYYVRFISHFVRVYESSAPAFAREAWKWSDDVGNFEAYVEGGRTMKDLVELGEDVGKHVLTIPREEADDDIWPYDVPDGYTGICNTSKGSA